MANFKPTSYQAGDFLSTERMNAAAENDQYLYDAQVDARYNSYGIRKDTGLKILVGTVVVPAAPTRDHVRQAVLFNGYFTAGSNPVVTATPMIGAGQRLSCVVSGIGRAEISDQGFVVTVTQHTENPNVIKNTFRVNYIAIGY